MNAFPGRCHFRFSDIFSDCQRVASVLAALALMAPWAMAASAGGVSVSVNLDIPVADPCVRAIAAGGHLVLARHALEEYRGGVRVSCSGGQLRVEHHEEEKIDVLKYSRNRHRSTDLVDLDAYAQASARQLQTEGAGSGKTTVLSYSFL